MKRFFVLLVLLVLVGGGYAAAAHFSGGALFDFGLGLGGDRGALRRMTLSFIEDIQFKDFKKAASYHAPDKRDDVDIPFIIERLFLQKPELLDITSFEIVFAELDSSQLRARVKSRIRVTELARDEKRVQDLMLFYHRESVSSPWYMELESSLRQLEGSKGKKH